MRDFSKQPKWVQDHVAYLAKTIEARDKYIEELEKGGESNLFYTEDIRSGTKHRKKVFLPKYANMGIQINNYNELHLAEDRYGSTDAPFTVSSTHGRLEVLPMSWNRIGLRVKHER